ncbi:MAG: hypothetical protein R3F65_07710 [bacterium]
MFVDRDANPAGADGSADFPFGSLAEGAAAAAAEKDVAVSAGVYAGLVMVDGVSVHGGYRAADGWSRDAANRVVIRGQAVDGARVVGVSARGSRRRRRCRWWRWRRWIIRGRAGRRMGSGRWTRRGCRWST